MGHVSIPPGVCCCLVLGGQWGHFAGIKGGFLDPAALPISASPALKGQSATILQGCEDVGWDELRGDGMEVPGQLWWQRTSGCPEHLDGDLFPSMLGEGCPRPQLPAVLTLLLALVVVPRMGAGRL